MDTKKTKTKGRKTKEQKEAELRKEIKEEIKEEEHKKEKIWASVMDVVDSFSMIISAAAGILLSKYIPEFRDGMDIVFTIPSWGRLIISFVLAIGVIAVTEMKGNGLVAFEELVKKKKKKKKE